MKIWKAYGSEHSANLVMIGRFQNAETAEEVKEIIDRLSEQVANEERSGLMKIGGGSDRYSEEMLKLLGEIRIHSLSPAELEHFAYYYNVELRKDELILTTEELEVSAFIKVMIDRGARVEIYSAHNYKDTEYGRGK